MKRFICFLGVLALVLAITPSVFASSDVYISAIFYDGEESRTEGDEYIEITNDSAQQINISGYAITANDGQRFSFPNGTMMEAGQSCRVYTNRNVAGACNFNWGSGTAKWNNNGDCAKLFDNTSVEIDSWCYQAGSDDQTTATRPSRGSSNGDSDGSTGQPCPTSGAWPAGCVPGGSNNSGNDGGSTSGNMGQPCPTSGAWPAGCVPGGAGNGSSPSGGGAGQPCPASGAWPAGCVPGGSSDTGNGSNAGQPCPTSGAWPAGCVPGGSNGSNNGGDTTDGAGQPCPMTGAWPAGCVPSGNNGDSNSGNTGEDAGSNTDGGFNVPGPNSTPMRFPETQEREFNADDFRRNVGLMRDTFRSFATDLNEGRPIPCGSYIGWINLWIIDSPVYTNVPDEFKALHVEWRWMLNEIVVRTDDARQFCSGTETGEKEVDLVPAIEFLIWGYPRSEQMVAELAAIPNP